MTEKRYLLCRPEGGLNDQLVQIAKCISYSRKNQRILLLDTTRTGFGESHSFYFTPKIDDLINDEREINQLLPQLWADSQVASIALQGADYSAEYDERQKKNFVTSEKREPLTFDFSLPHENKLLIHHACGGGLEGADGLSAFCLTPAVIDLIALRRRALPKLYFGLHVRNTDYKTEFRPIFEKLSSHELFTLDRTSIYLATDSVEVLKVSREYFSSPIFNFSHVVDVERSLHTTKRLPKPVVNLDCLADLFLLTMATGFFAPKMIQGSYSGFSVLVHYLRQRPDQVRAMMAEN